MTESPQDQQQLKKVADGAIGVDPRATRGSLGSLGTVDGGVHTGATVSMLQEQWPGALHVSQRVSAPETRPWGGLSPPRVRTEAAKPARPAEGPPPANRVRSDAHIVRQKFKLPATQQTARFRSNLLQPPGLVGPPASSLIASPETGAGQRKRRMPAPWPRAELSSSSTREGSVSIRATLADGNGEGVQGAEAVPHVLQAVQSSEQASMGMGIAAGGSSLANRKTPALVDAARKLLISRQTGNMHASREVADDVQAIVPIYQAETQKVAAEIHRLKVEHTLLQMREMRLRELIGNLDRLRHEHLALGQRQDLILALIQEINNHICNRTGDQLLQTGIELSKRGASHGAGQSWERARRASDGVLSPLQTFKAIAGLLGDTDRIFQTFSLGGLAGRRASVKQLMRLTLANYRKLALIYINELVSLRKVALGPDPASAAAAELRMAELVAEMVPTIICYASGQPRDFMTITMLTDPSNNFSPRITDAAFWETITDAGSFTGAQMQAVGGVQLQAMGTLMQLHQQQVPLDAELNKLLAVDISTHFSTTDVNRQLFQTVAKLKANRDEQSMTLMYATEIQMLDIMEPVQLASMCAAASPYHLRYPSIIETIVKRLQTGAAMLGAPNPV